MSQFVKRFDKLIIAVLLIWGTVFMLRMAYLPFYQSTIICWLWTGCIYYFAKHRYGVKIPFILLILIYLTVALDGLGNLFGLYNTKFKYVQYDEFTHTAAPALAAPVLVWLVREGLNRYGYRLPLWVTTLFAMTTMFTISGFYEVVELWDDKYMHPEPGWRIHGAYDTANDLQCDLIGMAIGGLIAYAILKRQEAAQNQIILSPGSPGSTMTVLNEDSRT